MEDFRQQVAGALDVLLPASIGTVLPVGDGPESYQGRRGGIVHSVRLSVHPELGGAAPACRDIPEKGLTCEDLTLDDGTPARVYRQPAEGRTGTEVSLQYRSGRSAVALSVSPAPSGAGGAPVTAGDLVRVAQNLRFRELIAYADENPVERSGAAFVTRRRPTGTLPPGYRDPDRDEDTFRLRVPPPRAPGRAPGRARSTARSRVRRRRRNRRRAVSLAVLALVVVAGAALLVGRPWQDGGGPADAASAPTAPVGGPDNASEPLEDPPPSTPRRPRPPPRRPRPRARTRTRTRRTARSGPRTSPPRVRARSPWPVRGSTRRAGEAPTGSRWRTAPASTPTGPPRR